MDSLLQGKTTDENRSIKRFGYVLSLIFIVISNVGMALEWWFSGWLYLLTMYFLTGSLWMPILIAPFYRLFKLANNLLQKPHKKSIKKSRNA